MLTARDRETIENTGFDPDSCQIFTPHILSCDLLTVQQAAAVTGIAETTIHEWIKRGHIRAIRPSSGGLYLDEFEFVDCAEKMIGYKTRVKHQLNVKNHNKPAPSTSVDARLATAREASELVGVPRHTINVWASRGRLTAREHRGSTPLYDIDDICELASHQSPSALISKAQAAISFAIDALEADTDVYGDISTVLESLHTAQNALEVVIVGKVTR